MQIIAFLTEVAVIRGILGHLAEPTSPPRLMPARGPSLWEMPGGEPGEIDPQAQPEPDYAAKQVPWRDEFDQRVAWQGTRRTDSFVGGDSCLRPPARQTSAAQVASGIDNGHAGTGFQAPSALLSRLTMTETQGTLRKWL